MSSTPEIPYEESARQSLEEDPHYLTSVTAMGDSREVVSGEDIYAANGTKLVSKGTPVDSSLRDRLLAHKLLKPIDSSLAVSNGVSPESLAAEAESLIDQEPSLKHLATHSGDPIAMRHGLSRLALPRQAAFKLTVAQEQRPQLFRHLIIVTLISHYLALRLAMKERDIHDLLQAALLHDLSELHIDTAILAPDHRMTDVERRHIYAHPITGYLIAREIPGIAPAVSTAVLQHQERLDGSGYPYGLREQQIGIFARIIGVADVCASILARFGNTERLAVLMRLNAKKYDPTLLSLLQSGLLSSHTPPVSDDENAIPQLLALAALLQRWGDFRASLAGEGNNIPAQLRFVFERMFALRSMLIQFGFDPDSLESLADLAKKDSQVETELIASLGEMHWQFTDLMHEIERRRNVAETRLSDQQQRFLTDWASELATYLKLQ